jgi:adenylate cyclase
MATFNVQPSEKEAFTLPMQEPQLTIGRDEHNDLVLDDPHVSRYHAMILQGTSGLTVCDLDSGNGTLVNDQPIAPRVRVQLAAWDVIRVGTTLLTVEAPHLDPSMADSAGGETGFQQAAQKTIHELLTPSSEIELSGSSPVNYRQELEKKERILRLFYDLGSKLSSSSSLLEVYQHVIDMLLEVTPASRCFVFRKDDQGEFAEVAARTRDDGKVGEPLPISRTIFLRVARERVSVLMHDGQQQDRAASPRSILINEVHSVMCAPIVGRRGLLGIIYVDCSEPHTPFHSDDLDLLNAIVVQTGIAIDMVINHERLRREAQARANLERFLPRQVVDQIICSGGKLKLGGERQIVTALFADLRDFTTLSENSQPELIVGLLNRYFTLASEIIFRHGGTLDKYIGDGLLALFGAPYKTEMDASMAVRAAVDIQQAMVELNRQLSAEKLPTIAIGIGINTGPAIVGYIGSETRLDYTAIGDTINTASRLESIAQPGQIVISEDTMQAIDESFRLRWLTTEGLKGKNVNLRVAEVLYQANPD